MSERPAPLLRAARLYQNVSAKSGATWFGGRWGNLKVVILENKLHNPDDPEQNHTHNLFLTEAPPPQANPAANPVLPFPPPSHSPPASWDDQPRPPARYARKAAGGGRSQISEDSVPFAVEDR